MKNRIFKFGAVVLAIIFAIAPFENSEVQSSSIKNLNSEHDILLPDMIFNSSNENFTLDFPKECPCQFNGDTFNLWYCCGSIECEGTSFLLPIGVTPIYPLVLIFTQDKFTIQAECVDGSHSIVCPNGGSIIIFGFAGIILGIPPITPFLYAEGCWFYLTGSCYYI